MDCEGLGVREVLLLGVLHYLGPGVGEPAWWADLDGRGWLLLLPQTKQQVGLHLLSHIGGQGVVQCGGGSHGSHGGHRSGGGLHTQPYLVASCGCAAGWRVRGGGNNSTWGNWHGCSAHVSGTRSVWAMAIHAVVLRHHLVGTVHLGNVNIHLSIFLVILAEHSIVMHGQQLEHVLLHL
ncbi:hypothetical protein E2C01_023899 [Portunus trituberculatus]|uniref:Uncharacterized protein n=1 Tax=Portunus trituberculatus TaxID=210409 RepID=A0A5B7E956_PORTR|nr:hypothetical protein [Portunus trituberculatus]